MSTDNYAGAGRKPAQNVQLHALNTTLDPNSAQMVACDDEGKLLVAAPDGVGVTPTPPTTLTSGTKMVTAAATPEALVASSTPCQWVAIAPLSTNTDEVYFSTEADPAFPLGAGYSVPINDAASVKIKVAVDGEGVSYLIGSP